MISHVLIPYLNLQSKHSVDQNISDYLYQELSGFNSLIDAGITSASLFMNTQFATSLLSINDEELLVKFENQLVEGDVCSAYTESYTNQLHNFTGQWQQTDTYTEYVHCIISKLYGNDISKVKAENIERYIQSSGFVYNNKNSDTVEKYRMKSELMSQSVMAAEILFETPDVLKRVIPAIQGIEPTPYISTEYFRSRLSSLTKQAIPHSEEFITLLLEKCRAPIGLCDFDSSEKHDDFMGSRKRTERDQTIFSPISTLHGIYLCESVGLEGYKENLISEVKEFYATHSLSLPNFQMRDIPIPFGPNATVPEVAAMHTILTL